MINDLLEDKLKNEFSYYNQDIKPLVNLVEVYFRAVPDGMLNEVRKAFGHITSLTVEDDKGQDRQTEEIKDAHAHLRRVHLDCLKLMCIHQQDEIKGFKRKYRFYNLNDVDNGNFSVNLHDYEKDAETKFLIAKNSDSTGKNSKAVSYDDYKSGNDTVYENYCIAYNTFCEAVDYIYSNYEGVIRVAHKHIRSKIISVVGWIISIVLAIIFFVFR